MNWSKFFSFTMFFFVFCLFLFAAITHKPEKKHEVVKLDYGKISKVQFEGHSYIVWQQNFSDCILHDPDCKCSEMNKK